MPLTILSCTVELQEPAPGGLLPLSVALELRGETGVRYDSGELAVHLLDAQGQSLGTASENLPELEGEGPHSLTLTAHARVLAESVADTRCEVLARAHEQQLIEPPLQRQAPEEPAPAPAGEAPDRRRLLNQARRASTDPDTPVRLEAVATALRLGGRDGAEVVHSFIRDPAPEVRRAAFDASAELHEHGVPAVITAVSAPDPAIATQALVHLSALQEPSAGTRARAQLRHDNPQLRAAAATYLGLVAGPSLRPAITKLLSDPDGEVRAAASKALATLVGDRPKPAKRGWWEPRPEGEEAALDAAQTRAMPQTTAPTPTSGPELDLAEVLTQLGAAADDQQGPILARLRSVDPKDVMAQIRMVRTNAPQAIARGAMLAIGLLELDQLISQPRQFLRHAASSVRVAALQTLALRGGASALPTMSGLLTDSETTVVCAAIHALSGLGARTGRQSLAQGYLDRVSSEDEGVVAALAEAKERLAS